MIIIPAFARINLALVILMIKSDRVTQSYKQLKEIFEELDHGGIDQGQAGGPGRPGCPEFAGIISFFVI